MATSLRIITDSTTSSGSSLEFRINANHPRLIAEQPQLGITSASSSNTVAYVLKWKASDGVFYTTSDVIPIVGLSMLPYINDVIFRLDWTSNISTINAQVFGGVVA